MISAQVGVRVLKGVRPLHGERARGLPPSPLSQPRLTYNHISLTQCIKGPFLRIDKLDSE
jgi:hypothetical protein